MNILFYLHRYPEFGGIEKVTEILSNYLVNKGYTISILSFIQNPSAFNKRAEIHYYQMPEQQYKSEKNNKYITELLVKEMYDIIIMQDSYAPIENYILNNKSRIKTKLIIVEHNTPNCGWLQFKYNLKTKKKIKDWLLAPYHYWYMSSHTTQRIQKLYSQCDRYVLLSSKYIPIIKKVGNLPNFEKGYCINNPLTIPPNSTYNSNKNKEILFIGRFTQQKGINMLLKIWKNISKKHLDWNLILVGGGELEPYIKKYIKKNQLNNISLEPFTKDPSIYYKRASILCLPSIFEGWGLVLTESMNYSCIPIAFHSFEAITEIINDQINGFIVPCFKTKSYQEKLEFLIMNTSIRKKMSIEAFKKSQKFDIKNIGYQWEKLFKIVVNEQTK
mgnify:FL=1|jgi:glycosyltransferase involved in cell wall biosynthesis